MPVSPFRFTEIAQQAGIDFVHVSGMTEAKHFPTAYGSGVAMFDYDNDGKLDLYFATMTFLPLGNGQVGPNRLYRNLGGNRFQDATRTSGLGYAGLLPRNRRRRHRQRRRPGRLPLQLRLERPLSQQRRWDLRGHQPVRRNRPPRLVLRRGVPRLRQRRRSRPLRGQLRLLEAPGRRSLLRCRHRLRS